MKNILAFAVIVALAASLVSAEPQHAWTRFRGPNGSGIADDQKPPVEFGPGKNLKWKVSVPGGLSSPIIAGDLLVITAFDHGKLYTIAYRRADGAEAWRAEAPVKQLEPYYKPEGSPAASTPATDGTRIVSYFGSCGLFCYDLAGKALWKYEMPTVSLPGKFGTGVSPIIADGLVILVRDETEDPRILALDLATGSLRWETKRSSHVSYSTPVLWETPLGKQVVAAGNGHITGYDLKTGAEKWSLAAMPSGPCPSPVVADGMLFFAGWAPGSPDDKQFQLPPFDAVLKMADTNKDGVISREEAQKTFLKDMFDAMDANGDGKITRDEWETVRRFMAEGKNLAFALAPGAAGDVPLSSLVWKNTKGLPYLASALVYAGQCIMVKDGGLVTAYDEKTGKAAYVQERAAAPGQYYASPIAAGGNIYVVSHKDGAVSVFRSGADKPIVLAKNPKLGERVSATPAVADNVLYLRTDNHLYAFAEAR
jgi:outer membrane protein assembly factor BamB